MLFRDGYLYVGRGKILSLSGKGKTARVFALLVLLMELSLDSHRVAAAPPVRSCSLSETLKMILIAGDFTRDRGFSQYAHAFGSAFEDSLSRLRADQHWVDAGAGSGVAATEYLRNGGVGKVTTVSFSESLIPSPVQGRINHLAGRSFESIPMTELASRNGRADLITDLFGVLSYTDRPDEVLVRYWQILKPGGEVLLFVSAKRSSETRIDRMNFPAWIQRQITGFDVVGLRVHEYPGYAIRLRKVGGRFSAPRVRLNRAREVEAPPLRNFSTAEGRIEVAE